MRPTLCKRPAAACGFTLVEAMISAIIVATMLVAALNTVGSSARAQSAAVTSLRAQHMAALILAEIDSLPYRDPEVILPTLGLEAGERAADRSTFDDIDDYRNYEQAQAQSRSGTALSDELGWTISVQVEWVTPSSPGDAAVSLLETNLKRIQVTIALRGKAAAVLATLKANVD